MRNMRDIADLVKRFSGKPNKQLYLRTWPMIMLIYFSNIATEPYLERITTRTLQTFIYVRGR